jgi:putative FmdB family regulatory protein
MPSYDYECKDCNFGAEVFHGFRENAGPCPQCNSANFRIVVLSAPNGAVNDIKTVGQLADYNWKKMGPYEREDKVREDRVQEAIDRREYNKKMNKLARMTTEQKQKYITDGKA